MSDISYEEYLASVNAQRDRDRDRFTGVDQHSDQPLYNSDGQRMMQANGQLAPFDYTAFAAQIQQAFATVADTLRTAFERASVAFRAGFEPYRLLFEEFNTEPTGTPAREVMRRRHSVASGARARRRLR